MALKIKIYLVPLMLPVTLFAAEVNYSVGYTLAHYTNINHVHEPTDSELSNSAHAVASLEEQTPNYNVDLVASAEITQYTNDIATDQNAVQFLGNSLFYILPGRLEWFLADIYTQTSIDVLVSDTPENRQNANALSTGPNYILRLGSRNNLIFEARFEDYYYELASTDNQRLFGAVRWGYEFNSLMSTDINYEAETVSYDDLTDSDYDRNDAFLAFEYHYGRNLLRAEAGYSTISTDSDVDINESRHHILAQNQRTRSSNIQFEHERILSDTSNDLQMAANSNGAILYDTSSILTSAELYVNTRSSLSYNITDTSGELTLNAERSRADYLLDDTLDQDAKILFLHKLWNLSGFSSVMLDVQYRENDFVTLVPARIDKDYTYTISYRRGLRRNLGLIFRTEYQERISTLSQEDYDNSIFMVTLEYTSR